MAFHDRSSFHVLVVSDHFSNDSAVTPIKETGHQLVTLCQPICADERAQTPEPLRSSKNCRRTAHVFFLVCVHHLLGCLQDWVTFLGRVERMEQSFSRAVPHVFETTDTSGIEAEGSESRRRVRSKQTYEKNKKVWGGRIEPLLCNCGKRRIRKAQSFLLPHLQEIASVMTYGVHEFLRHYQGTKHFPRDQRLLWNLRVGGFLILKATPWEMKMLSGSGSKTSGLHKWWGIESIPYQRI